MTEKFKGNFNYLSELFKAHDEACNEAISKNSNLVKVHDIESGLPYVVTKEEKQRMLDMWEATKPKLGFPIGTIIVFGIGGNLNNKSFKDMFYNTNNNEIWK